MTSVADHSSHVAISKKNSFIKRNFSKYFSSNDATTSDTTVKSSSVVSISSPNCSNYDSDTIINSCNKVSSSSSSVSSHFQMSSSNNNSISSPTITPGPSSSLNLSTLHFESNKRLQVNEDGTHTHNLKNLKRQDNLSSLIKKIKISKNKETDVTKNIDNAKWAVRELFKDNNFIVERINDPESVNDLNARSSYTKTGSQDLKSHPCTSKVITGFLKNINEKKSEDFVVTADNKNNANNGESLPAPDTYKLKKTPTLSTISTDITRPINFSDVYGCCKQVIGKGAYGTVRICQKKNEAKNSEPIYYAVKEIKRKEEETCEVFLKRITSEFCISSSLKHPNIIQTLDLFADENKNYFEVMEYCPGGDLFTLITTSENSRLTQIEADCFFKQIVSGVKYMHDMGVAHRDLKPENILLTATGTVKIIDFGASECFRMAWEDKVHFTDYICGSSQYIAPEEYTHEKFDPRAVDIWACGMIYMAMRIGRHLWVTAQKSDEIYSKFIKDIKTEKGFEPIEKFSNQDCKNVIYSILEPVSSRRLTSQQIVNCPWVKGIKCCHSNSEDRS